MTTTRPRLLDLFCGAGGAAVGYHRAGFDIVGVDLADQPHYPFAFVQADALTFPLDGFDAVHASPPCQLHTRLMALWPDRDHPELVGPTRARLRHSGLPYVIENVPGAPLVEPVKLCGSSFGLGAGEYRLRRHRLFECSFPIMALPCAHDRRRKTMGIYGDHVRLERRHRRYGSQLSAADSFAAARQALGIDWADWHGLVQAIPPAYTEYIGGYLLRAVAGRRALLAGGVPDGQLALPNV